MAVVSSRVLRNHTEDVLRRVERGERIRINGNRRPVAEIVPLERPRWLSGAAIEQNPAMSRRLREEVGVSVITLAELELGVLIAGDSDTRSRRLATLTRVREQTPGIAADERVASAHAPLAAGELAAGRKPRVHDTCIAATAPAHGTTLWTQDADFTHFGPV